MEVSYATTTEVFTELTQEIEDWRQRENASFRDLSVLAKVDRATCTNVIRGVTSKGTKSPMQSHRLTTILRLRRALKMDTFIQTLNGKEKYNLSLPDDQLRLRQKVLHWVQQSRLPLVELDRKAGLSSGQTSGIVRWADHYLSLRLAMQAHTKWIEPLVYVTRYIPKT